jgi:hypothetical protein
MLCAIIKLTTVHFLTDIVREEKTVSLEVAKLTKTNCYE